jgi:hypothetical protein
MVEAITGFLVGKPEGKKFEDPELDGKILLRWFFRKWGVGTWIGSSWLISNKVKRRIPTFRSTTVEIYDCDNII